MICYGDRTFCCSPKCKNECGRQLTEQIKQKARELGLPICTAWFCGKPSDDIQDSKIQNQEC